MNTALPIDDFIAWLGSKGIELSLDDERLVVRSSRSPVDQQMLSAMRERREELHEHLRSLAVAKTIASVVAGERVIAGSAQRRFWWLSGGRGADAYTIVAAYRFCGDFHDVHWAEAVDVILRRHAAFRTRFEQRDGELFQYLVDDPPPEMERGDIEEAGIESLLDAYASTPFAFEGGVLVRQGLRRISATDHLYVLACHHAIVDGRSMEVFFEEVSSHYDALRAGREPSDAGPPLQYIDLIHAGCADSRHAAREEASVEYWTELLRGVGRRLRWPTAPGADPGNATHDDGVWTGELPHALDAALSRHVRESGLGRFALLCATYKLLLAKTASGADCAIGYPVANRTDAYQDAIGCFVNTVAMRAPIREGDTFASFATRVQEEAYAALDHQSAPLERVVANLARISDDADSPLLQTLFALQRAFAPSLQGVEVERMQRAPKLAKFPLSLMVDDDAEHTTLVWEYSGALLSPEAVRTLHDRFLALLGRALREPQTPLVQLSAWSGDDLAASVSPAAIAYEPEWCDLLARLRQMIDHHSERTALICGTDRCSYAELDARSNAAAMALTAAGAEPDTLIGVSMPPGIERIVALIAILKAGAAYVPLPGGLDAQRRLELRERLNLRLCVGRADADWAGIDYIDPSVFICTEGAGRSLVPPPMSSRTPDSVAYVNFSSGTTGVPKAIACMDRGIMRLVLGQSYIRFGPEMTMLNSASIEFDAFTLELWAPLLHGGTCVIAEERVLSPAAMRSAILADGVRTAWLTSALFNMLVDTDVDALVGLDQLLVGGDVVSPAHVARLYAHDANVHIFNGYGPTENTTFTATYAIPRDWPQDRPIPLGAALRGTGLHVLDGNGQPVPPGVVGELAVTGAGLASGYVGDSTATAIAFPTRSLGGRMQRCYMTGDHVVLDRDGVLYFSGRGDAQVKINGFRIELAAIENVLRAHPAVRDAAAIAIKRAELQKVVAFVTLVDDQLYDCTGVLDAHLRAQLPAYHLPAETIVLDAMPLTANGKLDRANLRERCDDHAPASSRQPMTHLQTEIAAIWSRLLGRPIGDASCGFLQCGGSSLLAMRMLAEVNAHFGAALRFRDLGATPTVAGLALAVERFTPGGVVAVAVVGNVTDRAPLSPNQRLLWNHYRLNPGSSMYNVQAAVSMRGPLDVERLVSAVEKVYRAHASLHARIVEDGDSVVQERAPEPDWTVERVDASASDAQAWIAHEARRVFRLQDSSGLVARLVRCEDGSYLLQLCLPHIVTDGWSMALVWQAITSAFEEPESALSTSDFSGYAARDLNRDEDTSYWVERLSSVGIQPLPLQPSGEIMPRGDARNSRRGKLGDDERTALLGLAEAMHVSNASAALAVLAALLHCATGLTRFAISTPCANRDEPGAEGWVGYYASMLPIPVTLAPHLEVASLLASVHAELHRGIGHSALDVDRLLRESGLTEGRDGNPLQRVVFAWQEESTTLRSPTGVTATWLDTVQSAHSSAKFPLMLTVVDRGGNISLAWEFDPRAIDAATVGAFDSAYRRALRAFAAAPHASLAELSSALDCPWINHEEHLVPAVSSAQLESTCAAVASVWRSVLGIADIGAKGNDDAHFFALGGTSLACLKVQAMLAGEHGLHADLGTFLRNPRLRELSAALDTADAVTANRPSAGQSSIAMTSWPLPLTREQRRLWLLHCLFPSSAYNVPLLFALAESADLRQLERALRALLQRHVALRLHIRDIEGEPMLDVVDIDDWTLHVQHVDEAGFASAMDAESSWCFDPEAGISVRAILYVFDDGRQRLFLNIHHLFIDGQSLKPLMADLEAFYLGRSPESLNCDFADVVRWQQSTEYVDAVDRSTGYWRERLQGAPTDTALPADRNDAARLGSAGQHRLTLPPALHQRMRELARSFGISGFSCWLSALSIGLARLAQQDEVVIATPVANRVRPEFHDVVGFMANTLPIRVPVDQGAGFDQLADMVFTNIAADLGHQSCPLDSLSPPRGDVDTPPWSQVLFSAVERTATDAELPWLHQLPAGNAAAKYPLAVTVIESADGVEWLLEYDRGRYSDFLIERLAASLQCVMEQICARPRAPLSEIVLWTPACEQDTEDEGEFVPITELIRRASARTPAAVAIHNGTSSIDYATVSREVSRYAGGLQTAGVGRGSRVGVLMSRRDELPIVLLAALTVGAVYVPLDPGYPASRIAHILSDAEPDLIVIDDEDTAQRLGLTAPLLALDDLRASAETFDFPPIGPDDVAYIIYTSGSTGTPKGVAIRHESIYWLHRWAAGCYDKEDLRNVLAGTSICFDLSVFELFITLSLGGGITLVENVLSLIDDPGAESLTLLNTVPSLLDEMLRHVSLPTNLRVVNLAGEPLQPALVGRIFDNAPGLRVFNLYGPSEDTTYSTFKRVHADGPISIGRAICGTTAIVLDRDRRPLPDGIPGELYLGGRGLAAGYFRRDDLTAERFFNLPWGRFYRTGDAARFLQNGELEYLGRLDHQCKIRGYRIELREIESVLGWHSTVRDACVLACELGTPEARLVAFFTATDGTRDGSTLREFAASHLPAYMLPTLIICLERMPLTPSGKIDRHGLRELVPQLPGRAGNSHSTASRRQSVEI